MTVLGINGVRAADATSGGREPRVLRVAFALSLLLHLLAAAATWRVPLVSSRDLSPANRGADEVELILAPDTEPASPRAADEPTAFTSVPERQASQTPPDKPDYLAMHHSLAADTKLGDGDKPSADEEGEVETVEIRREELEGAGGVSFTPQTLPQERAAQRQPSPRTESRQEADAPADHGQSGEWTLPRPVTAQEGRAGESGDQAGADQPAELEDWWAGTAPSILKEGQRGARGDRGFDFNQLPRGQITSGVAVVDGFHLNTVAWKWAPWMQAFANELHRHWQAPYAYRLGLIDGKTVIRLVVEKDGRPSSLEVLETEGHQSLHDASRAALRAFAPYAPLPADFPERNLVITLSLHYPAWRR